MSAASDPAENSGAGDVVGSLDDAGTDREYVIADITAEDAWLSMDAEDAPILPAWR